MTDKLDWIFSFLKSPSKEEFQAITITEIATTISDKTEDLSSVQDSETVELNSMEQQENKPKMKTVITEPTAAEKSLRTYLSNKSNPTTTVPGSRARWATAAQIASTGNYDKGWLGRALHSSSRVQIMKNADGTSAYRI